MVQNIAKAEAIDKHTLDNLYTATSDNHKDAATRFQAQMSTVFPEMKLVDRPVDTGTFSTQQTAGTFKALSYVITSTPGPVRESISQYHTQGSRNYGKFSDKNLDALLEKRCRAELRRASNCWTSTRPAGSPSGARTTRYTPTRCTTCCSRRSAATTSSPTPGTATRRGPRSAA